MSNAHIFRSYQYQQTRLLTSVLPTCGIVDVDDLPALPRLQLTGIVWVNGKAIPKAVARG